jgi:hypothetical protein
MNYSLSKSQIGADKAQTWKHKKKEAQMVPCRDYGQAQINTDKLRDSEVWHGAHNLLKLRGRVYGTSEEVVQIGMV